MVGTSFSRVSGGSREDATRDGSSEGRAVNGRPRIRRRVVTVVGFVALGVVPVLGLHSLATADTGTAGSTDPPKTRSLSDEQRQCLADQGVTLPARPADATRPGISGEQRAASACRGRGLRSPPRSAPDEAGYPGVTGRPGCGSPTSNHQPASCSISRTVARSSSLKRPGWRSPRHDGERAVVPELVDGARRGTAARSRARAAGDRRRSSARWRARRPPSRAAPAPASSGSRRCVERLLLALAATSTRRAPRPTTSPAARRRGSRCTLHDPRHLAAEPLADLLGLHVPCLRSRRAAARRSPPTRCRRRRGPATPRRAGARRRGRRCPCGSGAMPCSSTAHCDRLGETPRRPSVSRHSAPSRRSSRAPTASPRSRSSLVVGHVVLVRDRRGVERGRAAPPR